MMALLRHFLLVEARQLRDANVRISILGRRDRLPLGLVKAIAAAERSTAACTGLHLRVAIDYSARDAILAAAAAGPEAIAAELGTEDVDFLIRTGGDQRRSDFMLWECAQAELYFTRVKWPDFGPAEFDTALAEYGTRVRSFGGNVEPVRA